MRTVHLANEFFATDVACYGLRHNLVVFLVWGWVVCTVVINTTSIVEVPKYGGCSRAEAVPAAVLKDVSRGRT